MILYMCVQVQQLGSVIGQLVCPVLQVSSSAQRSPSAAFYSDKKEKNKKKTLCIV